MKDTPEKTGECSGLSRREFIALATGSAVGSMLGSPFIASAARAAESTAKAGSATRRPLNLLFIFTDQERYFPSLPGGIIVSGTSSRSYSRGV